MDTAQPKPTFFPTPAHLQKWFEKYHASAAELLVGFYKKDSGRPSITWPESVDEALCVGWIDGIRRRLDEASYTIRFTPRRSGSTWSVVNIKRAQTLIAQGRMRPAGLKAFEARQENRSGIYSYEQRSAQLAEPYAKKLKHNKAAWSFYQAQPASYRKAVNWWVVSAKQEATRLKRLEKLMEACAHQRLISQFTRRNPAKRT